MRDERFHRSFFFLLFSILLLSGSPVRGQKVEKFNAFGLQYRPILAAPILDTGPIERANEEFTVTVSPELGHDIGAVLRWGIGERFAIETGIDQIRRNFEIIIDDDKSDHQDRMDFGMLAYQIPLRALLYVRMGERLYANVAAGAVGDIYPTDWSISKGRSSQFTQRFNWLIGGFTANLGLEYRSESSGSFYLGGSYHRPLSQPPSYSANIAAMRVQYKRDKKIHESTFPITGNYITLDLKYFFPREK